MYNNCLMLKLATVAYCSHTLSLWVQCSVHQSPNSHQESESAAAWENARYSHIFSLLAHVLLLSFTSSGAATLPERAKERARELAHVHTHVLSHTHIRLRSLRLFRSPRVCSPTQPPPPPSPSGAEALIINQLRSLQISQKRVECASEQTYTQKVK